MQIHTTRLLIRRVGLANDQADLVKLLSQPVLTGPAGLRINTASEAALTFSIRMLVRDVRLLAIILNKEPEKICGLMIVSHRFSQQDQPLAHQYELGYLLDRQFWGQGIMSEAVKALVNHLPVGNVLTASTMVQNVRSQRVLSRNGFHQWGNHGDMLDWKFDKKLAPGKY